MPREPESENRRPGRPRDESIESRVLEATIELLKEKPPGQDVTMRELASRSGVALGAIYRRWPGRREVMVAALDHHRAPVRTIDADPGRETLITQYAKNLAPFQDGDIKLLEQRLIFGLRDPQLQQAYWQQHVHRRRTQLLGTLRSWQASGHLHAEADLEAVLDLLNGAIYYQGVVRGDWNSPEALRRIGAAISTLWQGLSPAPVSADARSPG